MDIKRAVGQRLKELRQRRKFTQEALADAAGLHRAYVGQIERGEKYVGLKNLQKIARALSVGITDLLKGF